MEIIRLKNGIEFDVIPMGIDKKEATRSFTVSSELPYSDILSAFEDVEKIEYLSETGEVLAVYTDCVKSLSITKDLENNTYTVIVSTDATGLELKRIQENILLTELALTEIYEMMIGGF